MTLADGVPPDNLAAVTDLGDVTYPHDDHHRALAEAVDQLQVDLADLASGATAAYLEFLADSQTPYFMQIQNGTGNWFKQRQPSDRLHRGRQPVDHPAAPGAAARRAHRPVRRPRHRHRPDRLQPRRPVLHGAGAVPGVEDWDAVDPLGFDHRRLGGGGRDLRLRMFFHGEDGTNQNYANGSGPSNAGAMGPGTSPPACEIRRVGRLDDQRTGPPRRQPVFDPVPGAIHRRPSPASTRSTPG